MSHNQILDDEIKRLRNYETAYKVWDEKTEWVQQTAKPKELGMHRADVLKMRIANLEEQVKKQDTMLRDLYMVMLGQPGHGDFSREQRTYADLKRYIAEKD